MVFILSHIQEQAGNKFEVTLGAGVEQAFTANLQRSASVLHI